MTRRLPIACLLAVTAAACGSNVPTPSSPSVRPTPAPTAIPTPTPTTPNAASVAPTGVDPDPSLLDLVPATAAKATLVYDPETTASVAADPSLASDVSYLAIGLARPTGAPADGPDFAIVNVARPRDETATDDEWFRTWRDTYDTAACDRAGGVARHAEFAVAGLTVFSAACANDAFTYHALIADRGIVLSITSVGPANLGRAIVEKLHP